jgi:hypothetical protein
LKAYVEKHEQSLTLASSLPLLGLFFLPEGGDIFVPYDGLSANQDTSQELP